MKDKQNEVAQTWENVRITHANPVRRTVDVEIDGKPGPKRVRVVNAIEMGTSAAPSVHPGDKGNMIKILRGHYFLTTLTPKESKKGAAAKGAPAKREQED